MAFLSKNAVFSMIHQNSAARIGLEPCDPLATCKTLTFLYLYLDRTADPLWSKGCHHVTLAGRLARGTATGWNSCWTGRGPMEFGCPRCGCCCYAAGEGKVPVVRLEPPGTANIGRDTIKAETYRADTQTGVTCRPSAPPSLHCL